MNRVLRSLGALSFLPPQEVVAGFMELRGEFRMDDPVRKILDYFNTTYVGYTWDECLFPIPFWNVRERFKNGIIRTNNPKEGWQYRFSTQHFRFKPKMGASIATIQRKEVHWRQEWEKRRGGLGGYSSKTKYRRIEERLHKIIQSQENQAFHNYKDFLDKIQHCLHKFVREAGTADDDTE